MARVRWRYGTRPTLLPSRLEEGRQEGTHEIGGKGIDRLDGIRQTPLHRHALDVRVIADPDVPQIGEGKAIPVEMPHLLSHRREGKEASINEQARAGVAGDELGIEKVNHVVRLQLQHLRDDLGSER